MFFERHVILDIQRTFTRQNVMAKAFDGNTIKMKTASQANLNNKSNLSNKEQKPMFRAVSRSGVEFGFARPFFVCAIGCPNKIACPKKLIVMK